MCLRPFLHLNDILMQPPYIQLPHRHEGDKKESVPITTRQLEALIRLSQARAKACLRPYVLREDAEDVIELMIESNRQVHTDETGKIDRSRGGAGGKSKGSKAFVAAMRSSGKSTFSFNDLQGIADRVNLPLGTDLGGMY